MATPFAHTEVKHVRKIGRRRSHSFSFSQADSRHPDELRNSTRRKQFLAQFKTNQVEQEKSFETEMFGSEAQEQEFHPPIVTRVVRSLSTVSSEESSGSTAPRPVRHQALSAANTQASMPITIVAMDTSQISSDLCAASSKNLVKPSGTFDQEFRLSSAEHAKRSDTKSHGSVKIHPREKSYAVGDQEVPMTSSAGFMAAIIAIVIGVIAFAVALTALVLVLLLRSTVSSSLGTGSSASGDSSSSSSSNGSGSSGSGTLPTECSAYTTINDPTRNVGVTGYPLNCDNSAPFINRTFPVWIRFVGSGGTTLPLTTPGISVCGTDRTGWYDGTMPSSDGEIVNGTACFSGPTSVCQYSVSISVANCGSFYLYDLPPAPICMARYCTI